MSNIAAMPLDSRRVFDSSRRVQILIATLQGVIDELHDLTITRSHTVAKRAEELMELAPRLMAIAAFADVNSKPGDAA